jgi:hypothetical protein
MKKLGLAGLLLVLGCTSAQSPKTTEQDYWSIMKGIISIEDNIIPVGSQIVEEPYLEYDWISHENYLYTFIFNSGPLDSVYVAKHVSEEVFWPGVWNYLETLILPD